MAELMGIGLTHAPHFQFPDEHMADLLRFRLRNPETPAAMRDPANWPEPMRREWGDDEGLTAARAHRAELVRGFRAARRALEEFDPDVVLIWGDDQYENFQEDLVPPFCVYGLGELDCHFFAQTYATEAKANIWGEPPESVVRVESHVDAANVVADGLLRAGFDVSYSYRLHHSTELSHAFVRTMLYLDYDRAGWRWPILPFHVNCYGSDLTPPDFISQGRSVVRTAEKFPRPPAPSPWRCYDLGKQVSRVLSDSPWRVAVIGSSSWSHAFLTRKFPAGHPDVEADRARLAELRAGEQHRWRELDLAELREAGQHEFLNWVCLAGAMEGRKAEVLSYGETYVFNSNKCVAVFR
jgi:aromatic ring-opening dioxygenase LigB subunit